MNNRFHSKEGENGGGVRTEGRAENFLPQGEGLKFARNVEGGERTAQNRRTEKKKERRELANAQMYE